MTNCERCNKELINPYSDKNKLCYECWEYRFNARQDKTVFSEVVESE